MPPPPLLINRYIKTLADIFPATIFPWRSHVSLRISMTSRSLPMASDRVQNLGVVMAGNVRTMCVAGS
ncbi:hypothetical protein E2562_034973 [Oryza meyeriana var. granulata]|uniref:Uncharacterized protein n=1 Tax=Oryza meyeriana var. granulata TaxID=110450 RepID=A0A6G1FF34_9ORYZ|nr:hypothetical protein E2562_034973 [Oryza meyeriana var. granulata]